MDANALIQIAEIISALGIIGALSVNYYKVKVHHKVLFGDHGEINFITQEKQKEIDKEIEEKLSSAQHSECPFHGAISSTQTEMKSQQKLNVQKLESLEGMVKDGQRIREEMNKKLTTICLNVNTLLANQKHIAEDVRLLKGHISS